MSRHEDRFESLAADHWVLGVKPGNLPSTRYEIPRVMLRRSSVSDSQALTPAEARDLARSLTLAADFADGKFDPRQEG